MVKFSQWFPGEFHPNQLAAIRKAGFELVEAFVTAVGDMPPNRFSVAMLPGMGFADSEDTDSPQLVGTAPQSADIFYMKRLVYANLKIIGLVYLHVVMIYTLFDFCR
jgi:hypothetical protein